jgi:hypothetical protein
LAPSHFAQQGDFRDFCFPTLLELNDQFDPFPLANNEERIKFLNSDTVEETHVMYHGPPPSPSPLPALPGIPPISILVRSIIDSQDRLFFVSHSLGNPSIREWRLTRVAFEDSTALSPSCLQDGRFLMEFYTIHYDDIRFNATNQPYWLQYHSLGELTTPSSATKTHLICPSNTSESLAVRLKLVPFRRWLTLTHSDTYLHGPFDFATINGRKTRDRVAQADWDILSHQRTRFQNLLP